MSKIFWNDKEKKDNTFFSQQQLMLYLFYVKNMMFLPKQKVSDEVKNIDERKTERRKKA